MRVSIFRCLRCLKPGPSHVSKIVTISLICTILVVILPLNAGCKDISGTQQRVLNVGMILGSGGLGDRSFNDSAYEGLLQAQKKYNIRFETVNYTGGEPDVEALRNFAKNEYDLIMGVAYENANTITRVAAEFPEINFAIIDTEVEATNIASIVYREQEGDFLMGVLAAMLTKTQKVGIIGGTDIPAIRRIISGFEQGVAYQDGNVDVTVDIAGTFSDPQVGLQLALDQYNNGVDIIHNAASRTGLGIIEAARQVGKLTTGTSGDQRYLAPGTVVGNRPKRVDTAVEMLIKEVREGTFMGGVRSLGLKENGISLGPFDESIVSNEIMNRLQDLRQQIIDSKIIIRD